MPEYKVHLKRPVSDEVMEQDEHDRDNYNIMRLYEKSNFEGIGDFGGISGAGVVKKSRKLRRSKKKKRVKNYVLRKAKNLSKYFTSI